MTDSLRITLLNPHVDDFVKTPLSFRLARRRGLEKYAYLIDEPVKRGQQVDILIDGTLSSLGGQEWFANLPRWLRLLVLKLELRFWIAINKLEGKVVLHWSANTISDRTALYMFSYKNCVGTFAERKRQIDKFTYKLINLSHYFIRTAEKARNIYALQNVVLVSESDLRANRYFNDFFPAVLPFLILPFAVAERFTPAIPLAERKQICAATGSFHDLRNETPKRYYEDFIAFFGLDTYHPVRKLLYRERANLKDWLDSRISPYREKSSRRSPIAKLLTALGLDIAQSEYFSFDIVDFYNQHKFAIIGEEASGSPTIGFFEAMACGCVCLGQRGSFYDGLGIEPDGHFLVHDGSIESIRATVYGALADPARLANISESGKKYVSEHCRGSTVWMTLQDKLPKLLKGM